MRHDPARYDARLIATAAAVAISLVAI